MSQMTEKFRQEVVAQAKNLPRTELSPWVGRLWYNNRRFSWAIRYDGEPRRFDRRSRWEPVEVVSA